MPMLKIIKNKIMRSQNINISKTKNFFYLLLSSYFLLLTSYLTFNMPPDSFAQTEEQSLLVLSFPKTTKSKAQDSISRKDLVRQIEILKQKGFSLVSLDDVEQFLYHRKKLPDKAVLITLWGLRENYLNAYPLFKKLGIRPVMFLDVEAMNKGNHTYISWHDAQKIAKEGQWDLGILEKSAGNVQKARNDLEKKAKTKVKTLLCFSEQDTENLKKEFPLLFLHKASDGFNKKGQLPPALNVLFVPVDWEAADLAYFLDHALTRQEDYTDDFKESVVRDWLTPWGKTVTEKGNFELRSNPDGNGAETWLLGTNDWQDVSFNMDYQLFAAEQMWVYLRYQDPQNYIRLGQSQGQFYLQQKIQGEFQGLKSKLPSLNDHLPQTIRVIIRDTYANGYLNGQRLFRQPLKIDSSLRAGKIGLSLWEPAANEAVCRIDKISVQRIPPLAADCRTKEECLEILKQKGEFLTSLSASEDLRKDDQFKMFCGYYQIKLTPPLSADREGAATRLNQGEDFYKKEKFQEALEEFKQAVLLDPGFLKGWENLGWAYWKLGEIDQTIRIWENIRLVTPQDYQLLNILAKSYTAQGNLDKAFNFYTESLKISPDQEGIEENQAKILGWMKRYTQAIERLKKLLQQNPNDDQTRFLLAAFLTRSQQDKEALGYWEYLVKKSPQEKKYKLGLERSLYALEQYDQALDILKQILTEDPQDVTALESLADDAVFTRDYKKAQKILKQIVAIDPQRLSALNKLIKISAALLDYQEVIKASPQSLAVNPHQPFIHILYADALQANGHSRKAFQEYQYILSLNPNNISAHTGLKNLFAEEGQYAKAIKEINYLLAMDPSNINLRMDMAKILSYQGKYARSIDLLKKLLTEIQNRPTIFILLYHGITSKERSDILKAGDLREQLELLKKLGYTPITPEDLVLAWDKKKTLPSKSVMITFDDARRDSFQYADPVLKQAQYKAVMFVPVNIINENNPFFSSWEEIQQYQESGRWIIQGHGNLSHEDIVVKEEEQGNFLANKEWLSDQKRLETAEEFKSRIRLDYQSCRQMLEQLTHQEIYAFAFPEGDLGQMDFSNYSGAYAENLSAVKDFYKMSFIEDEGGFNLTGDNPYLLKRFEVPWDWTKEKFYNHVTQKEPKVRIKKILADILRWMGQKQAALKLYEELEKESPHNEEVLLGKAYLFKETKDWDKAKEIFQEILSIDPQNKQAREGLKEAEMAIKPRADTRYSFFKDNKTRKIMEWEESVNYPVSGRLSLETAFTRAFFEEENVEDISENRFSLSSLYGDDLKSLKISYHYRDFSRTEDAHNYAAEANFPLFFIDRITLRNSLENVETAKAIQEAVKTYKNEVEFRESLINDLDLAGRYRFYSYNDDNARRYVKLDLFYLLRRKPNVSIGYTFNFDDTKFDSGNYYAPNHLIVNQADFRVTDQIGNTKLSYAINYAVGYGTEKGAGGRIIHTPEVRLEYKANDYLNIFTEYNFSKTPTYTSQYTEGGIKLKF